MKQIKSILYFTLILFLLFIVDIRMSSANSIRDFFDSATEAYVKGDYDKSIELYKKCLELYPNFAQAYNFLALASKAKGVDTTDVISMFKKAIEIDPNYSDAYDNLAKVYYETGAFDEALKADLKAVDINPDFVKAHMTLGWIYLLGQSQPEKAIEHFERALKDNKIAYGYFGLGLAYFMNNERVRVLEMITALRGMDQEELAVKLETMVRNNEYVLPDHIGPLIKSHEVKTPKDFFENEGAVFAEGKYPLEYTAGMNVRIRGKQIFTQEKNNPDLELPLTGAQRIEELKKRGSSF